MQAHVIMMIDNKVWILNAYFVVDGIMFYSIVDDNLQQHDWRI